MIAANHLIFFAVDFFCFGKTNTQRKANNKYKHCTKPNKESDDDLLKGLFAVFFVGKASRNKQKHNEKQTANSYHANRYIACNRNELKFRWIKPTGLACYRAAIQQTGVNYLLYNHNNKVCNVCHIALFAANRWKSATGLNSWVLGNYVWVCFC